MIGAIMKKFSEGLGRLFATDTARRQARLVRVWRRWSEVVGPDLAVWARPLGHRKTTLLLGVEDAAAMQEMHFAAPEILERVNGVLGEIFFDKVKFDLIGDMIPLDAVPNAYPDYLPVGCAAPGKLGGLAGKFDPASPVGRCYAKYVKFFSRRGA